MLARNPANRQITWSCGSSEHEKKNFLDSLELTIIATGALVSSEPAEGSHSWNVSPDKSSATRCNHNSTTRVLSPSEYLVSLYSSHLRSYNSNFFFTQFMLPGTVPSLQIQKCPVHMLDRSTNKTSATTWSFSECLKLVLVPYTRN